MLCEVQNPLIISSNLNLKISNYFFVRLKNLKSVTSVVHKTRTKWSGGALFGNYITYPVASHTRPSVKGCFDHYFSSDPIMGDDKIFKGKFENALQPKTRTFTNLSILKAVSTITYLLWMSESLGFWFKNS